MKLILTDKEGNTHTYSHIRNPIVKLMKTKNANPHLLCFNGINQDQTVSKKYALSLCEYTRFDLKADDQTKIKLPRLMLVAKSAKNTVIYSGVRLTKTTGISYQAFQTDNASSAQIILYCKGINSNECCAEACDMSNIKIRMPLFAYAFENGNRILPDDDETYTLYLCKEDAQTYEKLNSMKERKPVCNEINA